MNVNVLYYVIEANRASSKILCGVSLLTSTAISVDRLLALLLGLRYRHVVTLRRVRVVIICFWIIKASLGSIWMWRGDITFILCSVFWTLSLVISIFCHTKIYLKLRHQLHPQNGRNCSSVSCYVQWTCSSFRLSLVDIVLYLGLLMQS